MSDASSIRNAATLPTATSRNQGSIRYNTSKRRPAYSNGNDWVELPRPFYSQVTFIADAATNAVTVPFFVANQGTRIVSVDAIFNVKATAAGCTATITKETGPVAPGTGAVV